ncbi:2',3'-cyclic-nucleotide 2'-phosphodiesterase / 3'-nucleotidase [[Luteovulum] sphaeroides subsp. megalophilum]|uniref:bifunctional 2',3'-cyclic-nucleotide 2'-phosphodiesterase/3'-nucleotidase n=1 Tax=Cereibacter sphaeroides TaxID=1063 RepID=UPI000B74A486|nr:bifunctional 2',3'-cyclic-nucleotide 2'-phosphodiesterase/3'-nucleotidase [Cereibacter sphaeroides]SNS53194.1 2',3'-cyclic-nucleotide 2'-phosphodiesterase / 3'-nucleotidase [[Luteovulum] sphaeroides subsp. megalophilum]
MRREDDHRERRPQVLAEPPADPARLRLRLLATTDLHAEILPYDYHADRPAPGLGLATTATLIAEARAEATNTLLFDNGDLLQGTPMGDLWAQRAPEGVHPLIAAMKALGYDAATVGNHDFDYGLDHLDRTLADATWPVVSSNAVLTLGAEPAADRTLLPPATILDREMIDEAGRSHRLRIGVLGLLPPQVPVWNRAVLGDRLQVRDIAEAAAGHLAALRAEGCDLVVALCHSGIGAPEAQPEQEDAALPVAALEGIDAVVTGHSHLVFPAPGFPPRPGADATLGRLAGKPAVMAGARGSHLGVIDLLLARDAQGWRVAEAQVEARPVRRAGSPVQACPKLTALAAPAHAETLRHIRRPIGHSTVRIASHFALVAPTASLSLVAEAQAAHLAEHIAGSPLAGLPILSAAAPFKAGGRAGPAHYSDVPAGPLALRHAVDLYIYPNLIAAVRLTGAQIAEWLERAASLFARIEPGGVDQPLLDPEMPSYGFDPIQRLTFSIDLARPARYDAHGRIVRPEARRILDLRWQDRPLDPAQPFAVATNSYRAASCSRQFGPLPTWIGTEPIRDILSRHIARTSPLAPEVPRFWRFRPMPGTTAIFETAPAPAEPPPFLDLTRLPSSPAGFSRFRLAL